MDQSYSKAHEICLLVGAEIFRQLLESSDGLRITGGLAHGWEMETSREQLAAEVLKLQGTFTLVKVNELCQDAIAAERERIAKFIESERCTKFDRALVELAEGFNALPDRLLEPLEALCRAGADDRRDLAAKIRGMP